MASSASVNSHHLARNVVSRYTAPLPSPTLKLRVLFALVKESVEEMTRLSDQQEHYDLTSALEHISRHLNTAEQKMPSLPVGRFRAGGFVGHDSRTSSILRTKNAHNLINMINARKQRQQKQSRVKAAYRLQVTTSKPCEVVDKAEVFVPGHCATTLSPLSPAPSTNNDLFNRTTSPANSRPLIVRTLSIPIQGTTEFETSNPTTSQPNRTLVTAIPAAQAAQINLNNSMLRIVIGPSTPDPGNNVNFCFRIGKTTPFTHLLRALGCLLRVDVERISLRTAGGTSVSPQMTSEQLNLVHNDKLTFTIKPSSVHEI